MNRLAVILNTDEARATAVKWCNAAAPGSRLEIKGPRRGLDANARMWAMLNKISASLDWRGQHYSEEDWKDYFCHALKRARWMPDEEGGFVPIGTRTSDMSKSEMADLIALMLEFGARHNVDLRSPRELDEEASMK